MISNSLFLVLGGAARGVLRAVVGLSLAIASVGVALASPEDDLLRLEEQRRQAIKAQDFATLSNIYAPEFVGVTSAGQMVSRDQLFRVFAQTDPKLRFTTDEVRVVLHGNTALFFGRLVGATESGTTLFTSRFSHVFVKRGESWVCVAGQSTALPRS
jgi:ketosteroid isomerase-like protein